MSLFVFLALVLSAATTGALFRPGAWYERLDKPPWTPPGWLFGPAWALLYVLMALAADRVWHATGGLPAAAAPIGLWALQLVFNALWSYFFFGLRRPGWALADLGLMWIAIAATIAVFAEIDVVAALMLAPYLAWVSFAGALNASILRRNGARPA